MLEEKRLLYQNSQNCDVSNERYSELDNNKPEYIEKNNLITKLLIISNYCNNSDIRVKNNNDVRKFKKNQVKYGMNLYQISLLNTSICYLYLKSNSFSRS